MTKLNLPLPRPVRCLHQIEVTSRCNLRCKYCPSPQLKRPKVDMTIEDFELAIDMVRYFMARGTQDPEVDMAGIGESTLHPQFKEMLFLARHRLGKQMRILFATNGLLFDEEIARHCKDLGVFVAVSMHRPEKAGPAINIARKYGVLFGHSADPALAATNWAGQVDWEVTVAVARHCQWVRNGWIMAMADGRLTTCSFDASGSGVIGRLGDDPGTLKMSPYGLCRTCDQVLEIEGYNQFGSNSEGAEL